MRVALSVEEWRAGFADGEQGRRAKPGCSLAYLSGWIEGDALRQKVLAAQRARP
jgi:hypothetical protein